MRDTKENVKYVSSNESSTVFKGYVSSNYINWVIKTANIICCTLTNIKKQKNIIEYRLFSNLF